MRGPPPSEASIRCKMQPSLFPGQEGRSQIRGNKEAVCLRWGCSTQCQGQGTRTETVPCPLAATRRRVSPCPTAQQTQKLCLLQGIGVPCRARTWPPIGHHPKRFCQGQLASCRPSAPYRTTMKYPGYAVTADQRHQAGVTRAWLAAPLAPPRSGRQARFACSRPLEPRRERKSSTTINRPR